LYFIVIAAKAGVPQPLDVLRHIDKVWQEDDVRRDVKENSSFPYCMQAMRHLPARACVTQRTASVFVLEQQYLETTANTLSIKAGTTPNS
jgi:hypothetical protein